MAAGLNPGGGSAHLRIGPGAGSQGGEVVVSGPRAKVVASRTSLTGAYLSGKRAIAVPEQRRTPGRDTLGVRNATANNLHKVRVDCETDTHVIEVGLDKRSSMDSVHQAIFAASLTGKSPMVLMIDTDGREDRYEFQVRTVAQASGVDYRVYDEDFLIRWQMTRYLRNYRAAPEPPGS